MVLENHPDCPSETFVRPDRTDSSCAAPPSSPLAPNFITFDSPERAFCAIRSILSMVNMPVNIADLSAVNMDIERLFGGRFPGYRACNTEYHDLRHTLDVALAMARLLHGYILCGGDICPEDILSGLLAALMHDTGYIQTEDDRDGTGAKYTMTHIERSVTFMRRYAQSCRLSPSSFVGAEEMLLCTGFGLNLGSIPFPTPKVELLGKMLGSADLLGQMADRTYLEKLLFLYYEFKEAGMSDYASERDMLEKTLHFYVVIQKRLENDLGGMTKYLPRHFKALFGIERNLYEDAMAKNIAYLRNILSQKDHRSFLRRNGYTQKLTSLGL